MSLAVNTDMSEVEKSVRSAYTEIPVAVAEVFIKVYLTLART